MHAITHNECHATVHYTWKKNQIQHKIGHFFCCFFYWLRARYKKSPTTWSSPQLESGGVEYQPWFIARSPPWQMVTPKQGLMGGAMPLCMMGNNSLLAAGGRLRGHWDVTLVKAPTWALQRPPRPAPTPPLPCLLCPPASHPTLGKDKPPPAPGETLWLPGLGAPLPGQHLFNMDELELPVIQSGTCWAATAVKLPLRWCVC